MQVEPISSLHCSSLPPKSPCCNGGFSRSISAHMLVRAAATGGSRTGHKQGHDDGRMPSAGALTHASPSEASEKMEARVEARKRSKCDAKPDGKHKGFFQAMSRGAKGEKRKKN